MMTKADNDSTGQGSNVYHHVRLIFFNAVSKSIGQNKTALGIGIDHLYGCATILGNHITWFQGGRARQIFRSWDNRHQI